jgi:hypothetical protein
MTGFEIFLFGIIKAALTGAAAGAAIVAITLICLNWDRIVNWLSSRSNLVQQDSNNLGFSMVEKINCGNYRTVYGILNRQSGRIIEGEAVVSESIDSQTAQEHAGGQLLIY